MAGAADLHHLDFGCILALFATIFTILRRRTRARLTRALVFVLFVRHFFPPFFVVDVPLLRRICPVARFSSVDADLGGLPIGRSRTPSRSLSKIKCALPNRLAGSCPDLII